MHLYFHVPFCARRCSYCDFAIAIRREIPSAAYADAVLHEWNLRQRDPAWSDSLRIETIYFGGGTPSLLDPVALRRILEQVREDREVPAGAEVTLEVNPDDVTAERVATWGAAGINRVSLGAQSFDPAVLAWMHRTHTTHQISLASALVREGGIPELSLDLIFGLPAKLGRDWAADLDQAFALEPEHLSLYGLTIEDHTPLARWIERGLVQAVDEDRYAAEFLRAHAALGQHGFDHYEVSNACRPGHHARHNSGYWRRAPYIGLGPSAHSGFGALRQWNLRNWTAYQRAIATHTSPVAGEEQLDSDACRLEEIYLGLRTDRGVPAEWIPSRLTGRWIDQGWARHNREDASGMGSAADHPDGRWRVKLTAEGWLRLDALAVQVESEE